jgi:hypothetical protein
LAFKVPSALMALAGEAEAGTAGEQPAESTSLVVKQLKEEAA